MVKRLILLLAMSALAAHAVFSQGKTADSAEQAKAGEVLQFAEGLTVRVTKSPTSQFSAVKLKGAPVVVIIDFDGARKNTSLSYKLTPDAKTSEIYLSSGVQKLAPLAVIEDFPSWGTDNDKEAEVLDPKEKGGGVVLSFRQKGSISLLFDVPAEQAKAPMKFSMRLRTIEPKDEQHSYVVSL